MERLKLRELLSNQPVSPSLEVMVGGEGGGGELEPRKSGSRLWALLLFSTDDYHVVSLP